MKFHPRIILFIWREKKIFHGRLFGTGARRVSRNDVRRIYYIYILYIYIYVFQSVTGRCA